MPVRTDHPGTVLRHCRELLSGLADLVLPPVCLSCREPMQTHDTLCCACWREINFIRPPLCDRLGLPMPFDTGGVMVSAAAAASPPSFQRARAVAAYDGKMRELVHSLKFHDRHDLRRLLGRWLAAATADIIQDADVILPVPLSRWRLIQRRFNQAAILAQELGRHTSIRFEPQALVRKKNTSRQVGLSRRDRVTNVSGAFVVPPSSRTKIEGRRILLIDDVITTGATVSACARALKRSGAVAVDVAALAIVVDASHVPG